MVGGGGIQFASLISASSRLFAAIVENFARVSGVILFMVANARAACSMAGLRYGWASAIVEKIDHCIYYFCIWLTSFSVVCGAAIKPDVVVFTFIWLL